MYRSLLTAGHADVALHRVVRGSRCLILAFDSTSTRTVEGERVRKS